MIARLPLMAIVVLAGSSIAACSHLPNFRRVAAPVAAPELSPGAIAPPAGAVTASALDTTTAAEKAAALSPTAGAAGGQKLGRTAVSLGIVTEPGIWLRSSLVKVAGKGRVETDGGKTIAVDLIPGSGSAQLSLAAFRALEIPLTALPEVTIFGP